jgi:hypothetical protein
MKRGVPMIARALYMLSDSDGSLVVKRTAPWKLIAGTESRSIRDCIAVQNSVTIHAIGVQGE